MAQIAILGCGTVGSGAAKILLEKSELLEKRCGEKITLKYILDPRPIPPMFAPFAAANFEEIENDPAVFATVEAIGGIGAAYDMVKRSLAAGKHVITANKQLVATHGPELHEIAKQNNVSLLYEGSVGGGIPFIHPLAEGLAAENITQVAGILNGTSNFILSEMFAENLGFDAALAMASSLGYAESDPSADVDGTDSARKLAIAASLAFGRGFAPDEVLTEGIRTVTDADVKCADALGFRIKLIAYARKQPDESACLFVAPMLVPFFCPLSGVNGVFNAVMLRGDSVGEIMFYGPGAGSEATGSAVVGDIVKAVKAKRHLPEYTWPAPLCLPASQSERFARYVAVAGDFEPEFETGARVKIGDTCAFILPKMTDAEFEKITSTPAGRKIRTLRLLDI